MRTSENIVAISVALFFGAAAGHAASPWRASDANTRGWQLMTPEERIEHQARVRSFTDYAACEAYRTRHHDLMAERATQRGLTLPDSQRDFCDRLNPAPASPPGAG